MNAFLIFDLYDDVTKFQFPINIECHMQLTDYTNAMILTSFLYMIPYDNFGMSLNSLSKINEMEVFYNYKLSNQYVSPFRVYPQDQLEYQFSYTVYDLKSLYKLKLLYNETTHPKEFNIAEKKDDKLTNNKNGKVILVKLITKFILYSLPLNPGAIRNTNKGIKISMIKTKKSKLKISKLNTFVANFSDCSFPFAISKA